MALARWAPLGELTRLRDEMEQMWDRFFPGEGRETRPMLAGWAPSVDVYEKDNNVMVEAELPGVSKEDVDISLEDSTLTIRGEMKREEEKKEEGFFRRERHYGRFVRSIPLPSPVKSDQARANFREGVLCVTLPKTEEEPKGKHIPVE